MSSLGRIAIVTSLCVASGFVPQRPINRFNSHLNSVTTKTEVKIVTTKDASLATEKELKGIVLEKKAAPKKKAPPLDRIIPGRYDNIDYSLTLPFLPKPTLLDGSHAGDVGFDPMGLSESNDLFVMQEAEIRHGRLAMLAVVGWPLSELVGPSFMLQDGRAPSVLNGFNPISLAAAVAFFGAYAFFEYSTALRFTQQSKLGKIHKEDLADVWEYGVAGDYNFDPANLYSMWGDDAYGRKALREVEVKQGRYAMVGITVFALMEYLTGKPIVDGNMFFHPNLLLPFLSLGYFCWSQIYQISPLKGYPITVEYTKDADQNLLFIKEQILGQREE